MSDTADLTQDIQSVSIDAFVSFEASANITQSAQTLLISGDVSAQSVLQSAQSAFAQGFIRIDGTGTPTQSLQTISISAYYYDIAGNSSPLQSIQAISSSGFIQINGAGNLLQSVQYVLLSGVSITTIPLTAKNINNRVWILRKVRNKGTI